MITKKWQGLLKVKATNEKALGLQMYNARLWYVGKDGWNLEIFMVSKINEISLENLYYIAIPVTEESLSWQSHSVIARRR